MDVFGYPSFRSLKCQFSVEAEGTKITYASLNCHILADTAAREVNFVSTEQGMVLESKKQQFTYSEVQSITNNFESVIGKGGFGTVYHGYLDGFQVAVKMLSHSSVQGYKEFQAEVGNKYS